MFYKVLFILTVIMFIRDINKYVKECRNMWLRQMM